MHEGGPMDDGKHSILGCGAGMKSVTSPDKGCMLCMSGGLVATSGSCAAVGADTETDDEEATAASAADGIDTAGIGSVKGWASTAPSSDAVYGLKEFVACK